VDDKLEDLSTRVQELSSRLEQSMTRVEERQEYERQRNDELERILEHVVEIGLRGTLAEFDGTPLAHPRTQLLLDHTPPVDVDGSPPDTPSLRSTPDS